MKKSKILLINQAFYPDVAATAQYLSDFAVQLALKGHDVTVLAGRRSYTDPLTIYDKKEIYCGIKIVRVLHVAFDKNNKTSRVFNAVLMNLTIAWNLIWMGRFDKVFAMTSPPLVGAIALIFSKLWKIPFVYWMMDINPDQAIEAGWIKKKSLRAGILRSILKYILKGANKIVVLDKYMKERIVGKGIREDKIEVIPLWSHDARLKHVSSGDNPFLEMYGLRDKFIVMYSGNHSICHPLDTLLEAALKMKENTKILFLFIGGGVRTQDVFDFKKKHRLANVIQLPYQTRDDLKYSLSAASLNVVVMGEAYVGIVHPSKIYDLIKIGHPFLFIGPSESAIGDLMNTEKIGTRLPHGDVNGVCRLIDQVQNMTEDEKATTRSKSKVVAEKFSRNVLVDQLINVVSN